MIHTNNRERFSLLQEKFGLEEVLADDMTISSYAKDLGFSRRDILFLKTICSPDNHSFKKRILDETINLDSISDRMSDEFGFDHELIKALIADIRAAIIDNELDNARIIDGTHTIYKDTSSHDDGIRKNDVLTSDQISDSAVMEENASVSLMGQLAYPIPDKVDFNDLLVNGVSVNRGVIYYSNGDRFLGEFEYGRIQGHGIIQFLNGDYYEGDFKSGSMTGIGSFHYANGDQESLKIDGSVIRITVRRSDERDDTKSVVDMRRSPTTTHNLLNGDIILISYSDGECKCTYSYNVWRGGHSWIDNGCGIGKIWYSDGDRYEGDFLNGFCEGKGILNYSDGGSYKGDFQKGRFEGRGVLRTSNGEVLDGMFANNAFSTKKHTNTDVNVHSSIHHYSNGDTYDGTRYCYANGDSYEGSFVNGRRSGRGVYIFSSGSRLACYFKDGAPNGDALYVENRTPYEGSVKSSKSGAHFTGYSKKGQYVKKEKTLKLVERKANLK